MQLDLLSFLIGVLSAFLFAFVFVSIDRADDDDDLDAATASPERIERALR